MEAVSGVLAVLQAAPPLFELARQVRIKRSSFSEQTRRQLSGMLRDTASDVRELRVALQKLEAARKKASVSLNDDSRVLWYVSRDVDPKLRRLYDKVADRIEALCSGLQDSMDATMDVIACAAGVSAWRGPATGIEDADEWLSGLLTAYRTLGLIAADPKEYTLKDLREAVEAYVNEVQNGLRRLADFVV